MMSESFATGLIYALLVVFLAALYFFQQRQIASRTVNPSMSAGQQKLMQYLPVVFAGFQLFFPTGLVVYYITQTLLRIGQNHYITRRFYGHDESLGRQAQRAGAEARELGKNDKAGATKAGPGKPSVKPAPRTNVKPPAKPASAKASGRTTAPKAAKPAPGNGQRPRSAGTPSGTRHPKPKKK